MREVTALNLLVELEKNLPEEPFLVLLGEPHYLKDQIIQKFTDKIFNKDTSNIDFIKISSNDFSLQEFINVVSTPPFFSYKLVIIKDGENISRQNLQKIISTEVINIVKIIILYGGKEFPVSKGNFVIVRDYTIPLNQVEKWIEKKAKEFDKTVTKEAIKELIIRLDTNFYALANEIKKLSMYVSPRKEIKDIDVKEIVKEIPEEDIFEFTDAIINMQKDRALELLDYFLKSSGEENIVLFQIMKSFAIYLLVYDLKKEGKTQKEINESIANLFGTFLKKQTLEHIIRNLDRIDIKQLTKQYYMLSQIDAKSKTGEFELSPALRDFIISRVTK